MEVKPGKQRCQCSPGYTGMDNAECTTCNEGTYKTTTGSEACMDCPTGTYTDTAGSETCAACL
ncbi:hypothetical protein T484DRAFT_1650744, partial [Baffinella frigidus]